MTCRTGRRSMARRAAPNDMPPTPARQRRRRRSNMPFETTVKSFVEALTDPARAAPSETLGREGRPDARRFAVYRNNVAVGLIGALEKRYPVTRRLVGDEFF